MNSLRLRMEAGGVRLTWQPPYLSEGNALPKAYHVWRRPLGSLSVFTKIGKTTDPSYLDAASGGGAWAYEVTAVMN
jgi:hypothetical protein